MIFNAGITLFNKVFDTVTRLDTWRPTYFSEASWHGYQGGAFTGGGIAESDYYVVRIPVNDEMIKGYVSDPDRELSLGEWTLRVGDLVAYGDQRHMSDYAEINRLERAFVVSQWQDNRRGQKRMHHFRIKGA